MYLDEEFAAKKMDLSRAKQQKNLKSTRRSIKSLEEHEIEARQWKTKHDAAWNTKEQKELLVKISKLLTKAGWNKIPASMLKRELELVVPAFWKEYKNHIGQSRLTKTMLAKPATSNDTWRTNLGLFLALIVRISEGKADNTVSTQRRAAQLISKKATKCDLLSEFVKADKSEWLALSAEDEEDELDKMRSIMTSNGIDISSHKRWEMKKVETKEVKIDFNLTHAHTDMDNDDDAI